MTRFVWLFALSSIAFLSGCAGAAGRTSAVIKVDADVIYSSSNCEGLDQAAGAVWISDEKEFVSIKNRIKGLKIGDSAVSALDVDFGHNGVLLVRMGRKPTSGYGIELSSKQVDLQDQTAIVIVHWIEPGEGAILAQMITSPCTMIKMTKGNYNAIRVVDQTGIVRAEVAAEILKK
jgi:hypothetical protein